MKSGPVNKVPIAKQLTSARVSKPTALPGNPNKSLKFYFSSDSKPTDSPKLFLNYSREGVLHLPFKRADISKLSDTTSPSPPVRDINKLFVASLISQEHRKAFNDLLDKFKVQVVLEVAEPDFTTDCTHLHLHLYGLNDVQVKKPIVNLGMKISLNSLFFSPNYNIHIIEVAANYTGKGYGLLMQLLAALVAKEFGAERKAFPTLSIDGQKAFGKLEPYDLDLRIMQLFDILKNKATPGDMPLAKDPKAYHNVLRWA